MKVSVSRHLPRVLTGAIAALLFALPADSARAATFTWGSASGSLSDGTKWVELTAPTGTDATDILNFAGDVGTTLMSNAYFATSDSLLSAFVFNQLVFAATNATPGVGPVQTINGATPLLLGGVNPGITQNGTASIVIEAPIKLGADLTLAGATVLPDPDRDKATVTMNGSLSGNFNIVKNGTSTFRLGSADGTTYSDNTWFGNLTINDGTIRFNNNAYTAPTALRSNAVIMNSANALLSTLFKPIGEDPDSSLRLGTLSGLTGTVEGRRESVTAGSFDSIDIVITARTSGTFGGTVRNLATGVGDTGGKLIVRGTGTQTLNGTLNISKDVEIGDVATLVLSGSASLGTQADGAIVVAGGNFRLDNSGTNNPDRLRNGDSGVTGVETVGGGTFSLVGNSAGTVETVSRLQLGSAGMMPNSRSGALTINVTHIAAAAAITQLNFQAYSRDVAVTPLNTVNFTANNGTGTVLALGAAGNGPRVTFTTSLGTPFTVMLSNGLLRNTGTGADATTVGWATVNGTDFATYDQTLGIGAVASVAAPLGTTLGNVATNAILTSSLVLSNVGGYALNSLKLAPTAAGQTLDIATGGTLRTNAFLLTGSNDFTIDSSGNGGIASVGINGPRYFHIASAMLTVNPGLNQAQAPIVKSGAGTLVLTNGSNRFVTNFPTVINEGTLRATPGSSLPGGELRIRGGVLEITEGVSLTRTLGFGVGKMNWEGIDALGASINQERGSGGFAAVGADATVNLMPVIGTEFAWEDTGFVNSGYALVFGSPRADAKLTWVNNISLTAFSPTQNVNYNARQFRAIDNPSTTNDVAVLSGVISGTVRDDFHKTGNGELILTNVNSYAGATLITDGILRVNGTGTASFLTDVTGPGTLGGNGSVGDVQIESGGTVAPGDLASHTSILSAGNLKFTGAAAKLTIELGGITAGGDTQAGYDRLAVTGGVTLSGAQLQGSLLNGYTAGPSDLFFIIINDGADAVQGTFAQGSVVTFGSQSFTISYTGNFTDNIATDSFTGGNDVVLRIVPEPGVSALLLLGLAGLGLRRRQS